MNSTTFFERFQEVVKNLNNKNRQKMFSENMKKYGNTNMKFSEWLDMYLAWSEISTKEDIENYYWHLEDEDSK